MADSNLVIGLIVLITVNIVIIVFIAFFKGYGTRKGENLATKEDVEDVLEQVKKVTETTEKIKTEISDKSLSKQRHADMKRDAALDIMRVNGTLLEASANLFEAASQSNRLNFQIDPTNEMKEKTAAKYDAANKQIRAGMTTFWQLEEIARLIFTIKVYQKMDIVKRAFNQMAAEVVQDNRKLDPLFEALRAKQEDLAKAIRTELEI